MHKCIVVKVGGKRNTHKVCKKQVNFLKTVGNIFECRGKIIIFAKQRENVPKQGKQGEIRNLWSMTKKGHQKFWRMKIEKFFGKREKFLKFSTESGNFSKIGGKSETGGKCIMASGGMDAPEHTSCPR